MSFPYNSIFWKEKKTRSLSRAEIYSRLSDGKSCDDLELLPLEQIALEASRTFKNTSQHSDTISWVDEGSLHQIVLQAQCFQYGTMPLPEKRANQVSFESTKLPAFASKFECRIYHPKPDPHLERPIGSAVIKPIRLKVSGNQTTSNTMPIQLPASVLSGPERIYATDTVATIDKTIEEVETATGLIFEDGFDDLDYCKLAILQIGLEKFLIERHLNETPGVMVVITNKCTSPCEALDSLLIAFDMTTNDLSWYHKSVKFTPHELWRQDDNGNQVLIETCICQADALQKARMFTERGHRQLYWAQRVKDISKNRNDYLTDFQQA